MAQLEDLIKLRNRLRLLEQYKKENRLDFMEWALYKEQNDMRLAILERFKTKKGPNVFVVFGGNRSGKSELGGGVVAEIFRDFKDIRIWAATLSDLSVKVQQRKLDSLIRKVDISYGEYNNVRGWKNRTIVSKKSGVLYFKTYDQGASAFQGDDIDLAWFDEECPYDVFQETAVRLGDRQGIFVLTFTALDGFTRLVNKLWDNQNDKIRTTVLTPFMNPFNTEETKKQLKDSIDPDDVVSRIEGKPHIKQGLIYKEFNEMHKIARFDYVAEKKNNRARWEITEGIDPHERTPHHWCRFAYDKDNDILYVVEEIKSPHEAELVSDFSRRIKESRKCMRPLEPEYCQIDTSSMKPIPISIHRDEEQSDVHTIRLEFAQCGIHTILCQKDNALGIATVKGRLKTVRTISGEIKRRPKLYVFNDLQGVLWEFGRYSWDKYESDKVAERKEMINKPYKKNDHYMDVVKYECIKRAVKIDTKVETYEEDMIYDNIF